MYSGFVIYNYQIMIKNFIITNNTQLQSYLLESNSMFGNYHFFFNVMVTDNTLMEFNLSSPLRIGVNVITPELIKSNAVILFNTRKDGSKLTNIEEFRARRLRFKYDGVSYLR